jgi:putative FmdB family regulatory protein
MPNYDYICKNCGHEEEIFQKMTDSTLPTCPKCKHITFQRKIGQGIGLQFQGSGFYSTDYNSSSLNKSEKQSDNKSCSSHKNCECK